MVGLNEMIATAEKVVNSTKGGPCLRTDLCSSKKCPFESEIGVEKWCCIDWSGISSKEKAQKREEWLARAKTWLRIGEQQVRDDIAKQYISPLSRFLAKARLVDIEAEKMVKKGEPKTKDKSFTPITKFEEGKWYRYHGKERLTGWEPCGRMDFALDGKPRKCFRTAGNPAHAAFLQGGQTYMWAWDSGFELWEEVPDPNLTKPVVEAVVPKKSRNLFWEEDVRIDFSPAFSGINAAILKAFSHDSPKPVGTPSIPKPIHITPSRPSRALIGGLSKRQSIKPKFNKPLDLRE